MPHVYAVLGAGRQGAAAAYDLARFGDASEVRLLDRDEGVAKAAAARVTALTAGEERAAPIVPGRLEGKDPKAVREALEGAQAVLSAVPYFLNPPLCEASIDVGAHFTDLGGNTEIVERELAMGPAAEARGVTITPDCGLAPGMGNTLAAYLIESTPGARDVHVRCGGLPANPRPPLDYMLTFAVEGLTNEYMGEAIVLRDGEVVRVPTLGEREEVTVEGVGRLEGFITSGGTSTLPYTYKGRIQNLDYKTLRYPGHVERLRLLRDLGLLDLEPVEVPTADGGSARVAPRHLLHQVLVPRLTFPDEPDLVVLLVSCLGTGERGTTRRLVEIVTRKDARTGFTAMEQMTAFSAAIVCAWLASGRAPAGAVPLELAMPGERFLDALTRRGIAVRERTEHL